MSSKLCGTNVILMGYRDNSTQVESNKSNRPDVKLKFFWRILMCI